MATTGFADEVGGYRSHTPDLIVGSRRVKRHGEDRHRDHLQPARLSRREDRQDDGEQPEPQHRSQLRVTEPAADRVAPQAVCEGMARHGLTLGLEVGAAWTFSQAGE